MPLFVVFTVLLAQSKYARFGTITAFLKNRIKQ